MLPFVPALLVLSAAPLVPAGPGADEATDRARSHYEMGLKLFDAQQREQALEEFKKAYASTPRPPVLFMMAQCEYLTGDLKAAREHYQSYRDESPEGEFAQLAKDRIDAINGRKGTFFVYTVPADVDVRIEGGGVTASGRAPNPFPVPRGSYRVTVSKPNYQSQTQQHEIDVAENRTLFFKLDPKLARLEIETRPEGAALYVNGARTLNPYRQDVPPGPYEIIAEAPDHLRRTLVVDLGPGDHRVLDDAHEGSLQLEYRQRSGRVELIGWSAALGGVIGASSVLAALSGGDIAATSSLREAVRQNPASVALAGGGGVAVGVASAVIASVVVPEYIPDNRALFVIGGMWMGIAEGATLGLSIKTAIPYGVYGGLAGLAAGTTTTALLADKAPTYGRDALIQSGAIVGTLSGALLGSSLDVDAKYLPQYALAGLNAGLGTGLALAYLPDQTKYGPSWGRVVLVDLAAGAGAAAGAVIAAVQWCAGHGYKYDQPTDTNFCPSTPGTRTARFALVGGLVGLGAGVLLTRNVDRATETRPKRVAPPILALPTLLPIETGGRMTAVPALAASGRF